MWLRQADRRCYKHDKNKCYNKWPQRYGEHPNEIIKLLFKGYKKQGLQTIFLLCASYCSQQMRSCI
jgi:hypothetical protein